jgi:hypothetical protein
MTGLIEIDGFKMGRDPREMTLAELNACGHEKTRIISVIRAKCLDCCADQLGEVAKCTVVKCALWPYRMNTNPFNEREMTEEQRVAASERLRNARAAKVEVTP